MADWNDLEAYMSLSNAGLNLQPIEKKTIDTGCDVKDRNLVDLIAVEEPAKLAWNHAVGFSSFTHLPGHLVADTNYLHNMSCSECGSRDVLHRSQMHNKPEKVSIDGKELVFPRNQGHRVKTSSSLDKHEPVSSESKNHTC